MASGVERNSLKRKLSPLNVWALAFGCIVGWGAFVMPGNTFLPTAGPLGTAIAMGLSSLLMIVIAFNYHYMIGRYPVSGGEFTYALATFGRGHAFVCAWFLGLSYLAIVPLNATALALVGRSLAGGVFQVGFHYSVAGYDVYLGELLLSVSALLLFAWLGIRGVRFSGVFQTALVFALVLGVAVVSVAAMADIGVHASALAPAFPSARGAAASVVAVLAVAPWAFVGFDTVPQASEEFAFPPAKTKAIMVVSILFGGFVYVALNTVSAAVIPPGYGNWEEYVADLGSLRGISAMPIFYAAGRLLGDCGVGFLGLSVLAAILSGIIGFYMAASRLLYSMAREGVLPEWFGRLHNRWRTPSNAILFVLAVSLVAPFFGRTALGWVVDMSALGAAIGFGYTSLAALVGAFAERRSAVVVTGAVGLLASLAFAVPLLVPLPGFSCSLGREAYAALLAWTALGVVFFMICRRNSCKC